MIRLLRAVERRPVAWKNGGGITREVATYPQGAPLDDFVWRISMAEVRKSGPFSTFPDVDRTLAVLSGSLRLHFADGECMTMWPSDAAHSFSGDRAVVGVPVNGTVEDLNVMTRKGAYSASIERLNAGEHVIVVEAFKIAVVVAMGEAIVETERGSHSLTAFDALLVEDGNDAEDGAGATLQLATAARAFLIRIEPTTHLGDQMPLYS
jgi:environmental stress-induced protein Ves